MSFRALVLHEEAGKIIPRLEEIDEPRLPPGDVTVAIDYSTLNYKDGMILRGIGRLVRHYPHIPGIDFAGTVESSASAEFKPGDPVVLDRMAGRRGAMGRLRRKGAGQGRMAGASAAWSHRRAGYGDRHRRLYRDAGGHRPRTPGSRRRRGRRAGDGRRRRRRQHRDGAVGRARLSRRRRDGTAGIARLPEGARRCRADRARGARPKPTRPLDSERWAGAIDAVGGTTLATVLTQLKYRASVAACGLAGGSDLSTSVIPFLLRGVNLLGIDSVMCPRPERLEAWRRLASDLPLDRLGAMTETVPLSAVAELAPKILEGAVRGRTVVDVRT